MKKKIISSFLLITITSLSVGGIFLYPKTTRATVPVDDDRQIKENWLNTLEEMAKIAWKYAMDHASRWAVKIADWAWQEALATLLAILKKKILEMLTNEIIAWIQGDSKEGPKFITNWWDFLGLATNEAEYKFSRQLAGSNACEPFKSVLIKSFEPSGTYNGVSGFVGNLNDSFNQKINCTFEEEAGTSFENFFNDFRSGGWKGWLSIIEPQNNFYGAFLMAQDEKIDLMDRAREAAQSKGIANSGWLGDERCTACSLYDEKNNRIGSATGVKACEKLAGEIPPGGAWQCDKKEIFTPGDAVSSLANEALTSEMDWVKNITSTKELGAYLAAIVNALINRVFDKGLRLVNPRGNGRSGGTSTNPEPSEAPIGSMGISAPDEITLEINGSETIIVTILDTNGQPMANYPVFAESSNPTVAVVNPAFATTDENGQAVFSITAISAGDTVITFKAGGKEKTTTVTVTGSEEPEEPEEPPLPPLPPV